ncbi:MAG: hypothetical protein GTN35_05640 [Nitrososphaeria archaeon]|nr:hypothetical protein [Nitrosopumilaceae archaeon]NIP09834.1 hypothetical protein [Nitrosopumilaceae archaeon]NIP91858.1 hypothetical protein [Nitrososphaeria archaeon]NIS95917.1 hypothetical protein [Nitrosopumilaceae archaeon]
MASSPSNKKKVPPEVIINTIWISTFLAMIFTLPALGIFLGIYYSTGNLVLGAVLGFSVHFAAFAFSGKISRFITKVMN